MGFAPLFGNSVVVLTVPWLTAQESAALVVVVVSLVFFQVFRDRWLLVWAAGWLAYAVFLCVTGSHELFARNPIAIFAQADFILSMGLFATAALMSALGRRVLTLIVSLSWVLMVCAAMRPLYFPDLKNLEFGLDIACRVTVALAATELLRYRLARIGAGPILFGAGLVTLNLHWPAFTSHIPAATYLVAEVLFGSSMLLVVLDDSRLSLRRLEVLNELGVTIARGQNPAPIMQIALEKLKDVAGAKGVWFQWMDDDRLVPTLHAGLSPEFLRAIAQPRIDETQLRTLREKRPALMKLEEMSERERQQMRKHGINKFCHYHYARA